MIKYKVSIMNVNFEIVNVNFEIMIILIKFDFMDILTQLKPCEKLRHTDTYLD